MAYAKRFAAVMLAAAGALALVSQGAPARANAGGASAKLVAIRVESATHLVGVGGATPLRVIGFMAGGTKRNLKPGEVRLHVTPERGGRILANHTLYPRMKGDLRVHATAGGVVSKPLHLEAVPF